METRFQLDENGSPIRAIIKTGNDATKLVEECMLSANNGLRLVEAVSKQMKLRLPLLRIHGFT